MTEQYDVEDLGFTPAVSATGASEKGAGGRDASLRAAGRGPGAAGPRPLLVMGAAARRDGRGLRDVRIVLRRRDTASTQRQTSRLDSQLYEVSCITCHGANLQGVTDRGPA